MAIDSEKLRRKALSSFLGWGGVVLPTINGEIDDSDKTQLLKKYTVFNELIYIPRHELAIRRIFPVKELITDE